MTRSPSKIYSQHVANLRELEAALSSVGRLAKASIAQRDPERSLGSLIRLYAFLIGAWAECRLKKLLHEEFGFTAAERGEVLKGKTQLDQWELTIDCAFRKHYRIPKAELSERTLGVSVASRRTALRSALGTDLRIVIEIRNKLAHGQWMYPFNSGVNRPGFPRQS